MDDVQSWWEVPCIAHFCSLFRTSFNLLDFDIEELEEALLTDSAENVGSSLIQDLVVRLLKGCSIFNKDDVTSFNYQMYLRRLFRIKCEEDQEKNNPFNRDVAFHSLPLRTKVEIIHDLCDFRLESDDVPDQLKAIEADSLRVEPLGHDSGGSSYFYFYGTRLYREDYNKPCSVPAKKRYRKSFKQQRCSDDGSSGSNSFVVSKWQVVCFTEADWQLLACKFKNCKSKHEISLDRTLREDFLPVLPRLFADKEKLMRKRNMDQQLRRSSRSILGRPNDTDDGSESPEAAEDSSDRCAPETDDEIKRRRLLQEKADRLLAEAIQREERKAGLQLRERRGGSATTNLTATTTTPPGGTAPPDENPTATTSTATTSQRSTPRRQTKQKGKEGKGRMTNNSLSACLPLLLELDSKSNSVAADEDDRSRLESELPSEEEEEKEDGKDATFKPARSKTPKRKAKVSKDKVKNKRVKKESPLGAKKRKVKAKETKEPNAKIVEETPKPKETVQEKPEVKSVMSTPVSGMSKTKVKSSVLFSQSEEDVNIGMHKVMEFIKNHRDAWPFSSAVEENYAPNYYKVILFPMNLETMEDKLDNHEYTTLEQFKADFAIIVNNCIKYNGSTNEYTEMVERLDKAFQKAIIRYITPDESDEEISIEYNTGNERKRPRLTSTTNQGTPKEIIEKRKEVVKSLSETVAKSLTESNAKNNVEKQIDKKSRKQLMSHHPRVDGVVSATAETLKDLNKWLGDTPDLKRFKTDSLCSSSVASSDSEVLPSRAPELPKPQKPKSRESSHSKSRSRESHKRSTSKDKEKKEKKDPSYTMASKIDSTKPVKKRARPEEFEKEKEKEVKHHHKHHRHNTSNGGKSGEHVHKKDRHRSHSSHRKNITEKVLPSPASISPPPIVQTQKSTGETKPPTKNINSKRSNTLLMGFKGSGPNKRLQVGKATKFNRQSSGGNGSHGPDTESPRAGKSDSSKNGGGGSSSSGDLTSTASGSSVKDEKKKCLLVSDLPGDGKGPKLSLGTVLPKDAVKLGDYKKPDDEASEDEATPPHTNTVDELDLLDQLEKTFGTLVKEKARALISEGAAAKAAKKVTKLELTEEEKTEAETANQEEADRKLEPSKGFNRDKSLPNLSAWFKAFGGPSSSSSPKPLSVPILSPLKRLDDPKIRFKVMGRGIGEDSSRRQKSVPRNIKHSESTASWSHSQKEKTPPPSTPTQSTSAGAVAPAEDITSDLQQHKRSRNRKMSTSSLSSQSELGSPSFPGTQDDVRSSGVVVVPPRWVDSTTEHWGSQSQSPSASSQVSSQSPAAPNSPFSPPLSSPPQTPPRPPGPVRVGFYQDMSAASQNSSSPEKINEPHSGSNSNSNVASPATPPSVNPGTPNPSSTPRRESSSSNSVPKNYSTTGYHGGTPTYVPRYGNSTPSPASPHLPSPSAPLSVGSPQTNNGSPHSPSISSQPPTPTPSSPGGLNLADYRCNSHSSSPGFAHKQLHNLRASMTPTSESIVRHSGRGPSAPSILSISSYPTSSGGGPPPYPGTYVMDGSVGSNPIFSHHGHSPHPEAAHSHSHHHMQQAVARYGLTGSAPAAHANSIPQAAHQHQASPIPNMPSAGSVSNSGSIVYGSRQPINPPTSASQPQPSAYHSNPYTSNPRNINVAPSVYNNPSERFYPSSKSEGIIGMLPLSSGNSTTTSTTSRGRKAHQQAQQHLNEERESVVSHGHRSSPLEATTSSKGSGNQLPTSAMNGFQWPHNLASLTQIVNNIPNPMAVGVNAYLNRSHPHFDPSGVVEEIVKYPRSSEQPTYTSLGSSSGSSKSGSGGNVTTNHTLAHSESVQFVKSITNSAYSAIEERSSNDTGGSGTSSGSSAGRRSNSKLEGKSRVSKASAAQQQLMATSAFNFSTLPSDLALYSKDMDAGTLYTASPPSLAHAHAHAHRGELYPASTSSFHTFAAASAAARTTSSGVPTASIPPYQIPPFIGSHPSPYQPQAVSSQPSPFAHSQAPRGIVDSYQQFFQNSPHVIAGLLPPAGYAATFSHPHHGLGFNRPGWI